MRTLFLYFLFFFHFIVNFSFLAFFLLARQKGADPFEINKSGQNALSESYKEGHLHITYFLKEIARRLKAYFAAKRLSIQLNIECCEHCLDRRYHTYTTHILIFTPALINLLKIIMGFDLNKLLSVVS